MIEKRLSYIRQNNNAIKSNIVTSIFITVFLLTLLSLASICSVSSDNTEVFAQQLENKITGSSSNYTSTNMSPEIQLLGTEKGQITSERILEAYPFPKVEISFKASSVFEGINVTDSGTFWAIMKPDGIHYGEGQGIQTSDQGEVVRWTGQGIGNVTSDGKIIFHGSIFYSTDSQGSLSYLNNQFGYFHFEIDKQGKTSATVWRVH